MIIDGQYSYTGTRYGYDIPSRSAALWRVATISGRPSIDDTGLYFTETPAIHYAGNLLGHNGSVSMWIYRENHNNATLIASKDTTRISVGTTGWGVRIINDKVSVKVTMTRSTNLYRDTVIFECPTIVSINEWHLITVSFGKHLTVYLDNQIIGSRETYTDTFSIAIGEPKYDWYYLQGTMEPPLYIGMFTGILDNIMILGDTITAQWVNNEWSQYYVSTKPRPKTYIHNKSTVVKNNYILNGRLVHAKKIPTFSIK